MNEHNIQKYLQVRTQREALEAEERDLRQAILTDLVSNKLEKIESDVFGSFTVAHKKSWKYSPAVVKVEERLKIIKFKEQEKGIAQAVESEYLLYKPNEQL